MKQEMIYKAHRSMKKAGFKLKKYSPEIMVVAGIAGVVVSAVMACKATLKVNDVLDEAKDEIDAIHDVQVFDADDETFKSDKKALTTAYAKTGVRLAKLYAPSVITGSLSLASILVSNNILRKRNIALAAAYTATSNGFKDYRKRVVDRFGDRVDYELKHDIKSEETLEITTDEKGNEVEVKKKVDVINNPYDYSEFAKFFDESCKAWEKDPEINLWFLTSTQSYANDRLKANGYLFLNDVYEMLGIPKTKAGQVVGWIYDEENPVGDNYVDFGIHNAYRPAAREFVNGHERVILLDFNVDGNIWEKM